jgi:RNase P subunit RPR2
MLRASKAQELLLPILLTPTDHHTTQVTAASRSMFALNRRHSIGIPTVVKHWICRSCQQFLQPGSTARVRVKSGIRRTTCLGCGRIHRLAHGRQAVPSESEPAELNNKKKNN